MFVVPLWKLDAQLLYVILRSKSPSMDCIPIQLNQGVCPFALDLYDVSFRFVRGLATKIFYAFLTAPKRLQYVHPIPSHSPWLYQLIEESSHYPTDVRSIPPLIWETIPVKPHQSEPLSTLVKVRITEVLLKNVQGSYKMDFTCFFGQYTFILKLTLHIIK
jgi:hypothetical protein